MSMILRKRLANNLRLLRERRGLSQDELAYMCNLHRTYIGGIERCERNITISTLEKIASALDVDGSHLIDEMESFVVKTAQ